MPGDTPEAAGEQEGLLGRRFTRLSVNDLILGDNVPRRLAPNKALTVLGTEHVALPIGEEVQEDSGEAQDEQGRGHRQAEPAGILYKEAGVEGVDGGNPDQASPLDLEACPVDDDVDRSHVPNLPNEKLQQVKVLGGRSQDEAPVHLSVEGVGTVREREASELPERHAEAAVYEPLEVEGAYARVKLGPPEVVLDKASRRSAVIGGGVIKTLPGQEDAEY